MNLKRVNKFLTIFMKKHILQNQNQINWKKKNKRKKNQKDNSYNNTNTIKEIIILTMRAEKMIFMLIKQNIRIDTLYYYSWILEI